MRLTDLGEGWLKLSPRCKDIEANGITCDSRDVKPGDLFIAVPGDAVDGHQFITDAVKAGAVAVIGEKKPPRWGARKVPFIPVDDSRNALGRLSAAFFKHPSRSVKVCGITGTKGKTTTSWILHSIFQATGRRAGLFGTILNRVGEDILPSTNTTPSALEVEMHLRDLADRGGTHAVMEVSSHGIAQGRISGLEFSCAVLTNVTPEHLDYHKTFENYLDTKSQFFQDLDPSTPVILPRGSEAAKTIAERIDNPITWVSPEPRDGVEKLTSNEDGISFLWKGTPITTSIWGEHNLWNLLFAINAAESMGISHQAIAAGIEKAVAPPGRLEEMESPFGYKVYVDYAHTDSALKTVLKGLRPITPGRLITVFGCGGNRDRHKRPRMGQVAEYYSDKVILTDDNPRDEDSGAILDEIAGGMQNPFGAAMVNDRKDAIVLALRMAKKGDVVLIAGKGHEDYQEIKGKKYPFDDRQVVSEMMDALLKEQETVKAGK